MLLQTLWRVVGWAQVHPSYSLEFKERGMTLWRFTRTWEKDNFHRNTVAVTDRFSSDATHEMSLVRSIVDAVGSEASLVAVSVRSHGLADTYGHYSGSGYNRKLVEYAISDLRLLKQCLQKVTASIFGLSIRLPYRK